jgi:hypothetical protein
MDGKKRKKRNGHTMPFLFFLEPVTTKNLKNNQGILIKSLQITKSIKFTVNLHNLKLKSWSKDYCTELHKKLNK